jgi:hypothetical protein
MRKTMVSALGILLITGSAALTTSASARPVHRAAVNDQFRNSYNSVDGTGGTFCSREPGNPYNPDTDYQAWSAWRALGAWDSRNDCRLATHVSGFGVATLISYSRAPDAVMLMFVGTCTITFGIGTTLTGLAITLTEKSDEDGAR